MERKNAKRCVSRFELGFDGRPDQVFPLLCPVREHEWVDGWSCDMLYSDTGVAELGGVFRTSFADAGDETWTISRYEPGRTIEFVRVACNVAVVKLDIALERDGERRTKARVTHTSTALSEAGEALIDARPPERTEQEWRALEHMMNHYLRTGTKLPRPGTARRLHR